MSLQRELQMIPPPLNLNAPHPKITEHPAPLYNTEIQYPLLYAASWAFAEHPLPSPLCNSHRSPFVLARDNSTGSFYIAQYRDTSSSNSASRSNSTKTDTKTFAWKILYTFDYTSVHAYLSDSTTKVRILGWKNQNQNQNHNHNFSANSSPDFFDDVPVPAAHDELHLYLDLTFVSAEHCRAFMDEYLDAVASWSVGMLRPQDMAAIFRSAPARFGARDAVADQYLPDAAYYPPSVREYGPAGVESSSPWQAPPMLAGAGQLQGLYDGVTGSAVRECEREREVRSPDEEEEEYEVQGGAYEGGEGEVEVGLESAGLDDSFEVSENWLEWDDFFDDEDALEVGPPEIVDLTDVVSEAEDDGEFGSEASTAVESERIAGCQKRKADEMEEDEEEMVEVRPCKRLREYELRILEMQLEIDDLKEQLLARSV
ncbi:hypothetical protein K491DRAFT_716945 [Lophiostoma macrostomum CBS 122681]|uniref:Uncharacterized protein n=1 Tax=Lophiostoma macrostomum CBS 122681 TaxID=1314788 RepID=A0A6A6T4K2_9PLEO|nr:hypothetical protein K491DRAFT_716945 [Lophiostoma macrostomum CBS 122681]